jgi:PAS domain S-box-containing protein
LSTFSDAQFDEATFEAELTGDRMSLMIVWYWILKLKARFLSGDYAEALAAADKAKPLLSATAALIELLDYFYYTALTVAALHEKASDDEQDRWRELLTEHEEQLREWAENYPPTFADKHALVSAEIARLEGRDTDAMRLYEQAIQSAREHGFVQNEGTAHEVAARFYTARGFEAIAHTYLRNARYCYLRWGALGKVQQLDELHPQLREELSPRPTTTIGVPVEHLDLATVIKVSQAVSGEIVLENLIDTLMRTAIEHAGAERGLLILPQGDDLRIEAEATTGLDRVEVRLRQALVTPAELPESLLQYVTRTQENIVLDDASLPNQFSGDEYIRQKRSRSILCLPLVKQAKLTGVLYLENNLTPHVFTPARIAVLELLASQAAISLENALLYTDLQQENSERKRAEEELRRSEAYLAEAQRLSHTGSFGWNVATGEMFWSEETYRIAGYDRAFKPTFEEVFPRIHPKDVVQVREVLDRGVQNGTDLDFEHRFLMADGSSKHVHVVAHAMRGETGNLEYVGAVMDVTARKQAEEALRKSQGELAHVTRVMTMGELAASIAHEVNQPLAAIVTNGSACLRWLVGDSPNLDEARETARRIIHDGKRASDVISRIRALVRKTEPEKAQLDINQAVQEVVSLTKHEAVRKGVALRTELTGDLPFVLGDRVQLQQVILNLIMNGVEAMSSVGDRPRELLVRSRQHESDQVLVAVQDSGIGIDSQNLDKIFNPFYTTKSQGMGMGLAISRSIVENHGGLLWALPNDGPGATFQFTLSRCR